MLFIWPANSHTFSLCFCFCICLSVCLFRMRFDYITIWSDSCILSLSICSLAGTNKLATLAFCGRFELANILNHLMFFLAWHYLSHRKNTIYILPKNNIKNTAPIEFSRWCENAFLQKKKCFRRFSTTSSLIIQSKWAFIFWFHTISSTHSER